MSGITQKFKSVLGDRILEQKALGRGGAPSIWVEAAKLREVAELLRESPELGFDWLENLAAMQVDSAIVLSYFLRCTSPGKENQEMVLRASLVPANAEAWVDAPSVASVWPAAEPWQSEVAELFGVKFIGSGPLVRKILPEGWVGFPLRKGYMFPTEVMGIPHMRRVGQTGPDEFKPEYGAEVGTP